jgi:hypothetical protein
MNPYVMSALLLAAIFLDWLGAGPALARAIMRARLRQRSRR